MPDQYDLPAPSTSGALASTKQPGKEANGAPPEDAENWSKVGWAPRFGSGETEEDKKDESNLLDHQTVLEGKLDDKFFGGEAMTEASTFYPANGTVRLVPQYRGHRLRLFSVMGGRNARRRSCMGLHRHGCVRNILQNIHQTRTAELPRRHHTRNVQSPIGERP